MHLVDMLTKEAVGAVAMAAILVLAGCSTAVPGVTSTAPTDDDPATAGQAEHTQVTFYVSDRPGAIDDFEHLNVTITKVGLHMSGDDADENETTGADDDGDEADDDDADDGDDTESANETASDSMNADLDDTETTVPQPNETTHTMAEDPTETPEDTETEDDESEDDGEDSDDADDEDDADDDADEEDESDADDDDDADDADADDADDEESDADEDDDDASDAGWVERDVDNATVDLTTLQGANATAIGNLSVPAGEYDKVFVYVSEINATLKNGDSVNVKLPSQKLQLNKAFTLSANHSPEFVFDINVHKAGNSGKYILRPVVGESGTGDQVEIRDVDKQGPPENAGPPGNNGNGNGADDRNDDDEDENETDDDERDSDDSEDESTLTASLDTPVHAGDTVTLTVTDANSTVANATVTVNGDTIGNTDTDGTITFDVPDANELEVTITTSDDRELEREWDIKGNGGGPSLHGHALS
jgi:hypothetical protein